MADGNATQVLELCDEGVQAEFAGNEQQAAQVYQHAWEIADGPVARCVGAHYLARQQPTDEQTLHWNLTALTIAGEVEDVEHIRDLLPVLYLNAASSLVRAGEFERAQELFLLAADLIDFDPTSGVGAQWATVFLGLQAAGFVPQGDSVELRQLLANLEDERHHAALAMVLPRYVTNTGSDDDVQALIETLEAVFVARMVDADDQELLRTAIVSAQAQLAGAEVAAHAPRAQESDAVADVGTVAATNADAAANATPTESASPDVAFRL